MIWDFTCQTLSSMFEKLLGAVSDAAGSALSSIVEAIRTMFEGDPETRRRVSFSVAIIALSAKMAKADGIVSQAEVNAFRAIFDFPPQEARNVARLYNLAKQDVAGYEAYAERLARLCGSGALGCPVLEEIVDALFHIATADGLVHENELAFLSRIADIFGISEERFEAIAARHLYPDEDPYSILGVSRSDDFSTIRKRYRVLASEHHPDRLHARGLPLEMHAAAHQRMAAFNAAYAAIEKERKAA
ncbi:DnaJ family molecular chaperone [Allorhizobium sp. BGMRC 0089]|uniref:J domain-containing protein n=1 Tax=Allorhizobium sonneratiae TaxID=2934936 RepID=UPI002033894A|nr:DnaJ family molecular chaperone [Allorhizobium sonneratiae]MCM2294200.1 DnaJ family molecular chaperone [Allorhizobium sonneratiae]